ncbi:adenosylmethionine--8-amino-7-oxononanoate transaminase [Sporichthya sp.]|uniref:adenosylmethionine--8-amino-7-oxononanoate transaminase n=1 Tax=Sporichthya sp. TaxID=65475 RepID=UPI0017ED3EEC|nr:adenosylmethionine--8-amino-7-oxononanoate transaminase [Sporichthya sp.]MBA3744375.1 adenosylmethionine--8-amino-7-oxononanoate transaminase [Sporichthya sp.]
MDAETLVALDRAHLWHPYASMTDPGPVYPVVAAQGVRLQFADGREVIDGMSSWWAAIHGYRHPVLDAAVRDQLDRMAHVMFGGLTHPGAVGLAQRLVAMTGDGLEHVFLSDSGSVSVEVAIKMAVQYWRGRGETRSRLLTVRGGYHGDTFATMAVCDPAGGMHHLFAGVLPEHLFAPRPGDGFEAPVDPAWLAAAEALLVEHAAEVAAVIVEPVVQGAGGMRFHSPAYVRAWRELCDAHRVLLILDEIATGFGRTGALFAHLAAGVVPDILCLGKAMTGGYLSMAATLCTPAVAAGVCAGEAGALMHGPTFMANPLAAAVACASLDLLAGGDWTADVGRIEAGLRAGLAPAADLPGVADVRVLGAIGVIETAGPVDVPRGTEAALAHGVWLRPFRNLIYAMPPYVATDEDVRQISGAMVDAAAQNAQQSHR